MLRKILLIVGLMGIAVLSGCQSGNKKVEDPNENKVILIGTDSFPKELVGQWAANAGGWEISFEENGSISSFVHTIGRVRVKTGQTTIIPLIENGKGTFKPGKCFVQYTADTRELAVEIVLNSYCMKKGKEVIEGNSRDVFIGKVSGNGWTWAANWMTFPKFVVTTEGYRKYELPMRPGDEEQGDVIFSKRIPENKQSSTQ